LDHVFRRVLRLVLRLSNSLTFLEQPADYLSVPPKPCEAFPRRKGAAWAQLGWGLAEARSDREQAELIRGLYRSTPVGVAGALFGVAVLCLVLIYIAPQRAPIVEAWFALTLASAAWQLILWRWYWRAQAPDGDWRVWARRFVVASLVEGARWGVGSILVAAPGHAEQQIWVCMVVACAASSSVSSLGSYIPAFYALLFPAMVPFTVWGLFQHDPRYWALSLLAFALTASIALLGYGQSRSLADALRLRFENLDLAEDLRREKEIAEQASLAKTQFLASASHDLRQPIHALGMFVAALRRRPMDHDTARIGGQISETVAAMTGLFDSLLHISQLDAGVVRPSPRTFALDPMIDRICREQVAGLEGRPVVLRRVPCSALAHTDPILLERMIRNVIANAVRHTRAGRILVGCRRGERISVEVWDSGPGIAPADQDKVFEEYYQLANPERDRTKGLGLGLAITRRLSLLLDCPITLRSQVGVGSMFRISAPTGLVADVVDPPVASDQDATQQGLVFFVDDELAIQHGAADLLRIWGYRVLAAGSAEELMAKVDPGERPDLLICDWRLRGEETALAVVERVRQAYGAGIPTLLITGETAPGKLREAHAAGLVILNKPVPPGKLRAAVANLARRAEVKPAAVR
jgi:signal transduction histidine kinase/CheY-like chemotaxis protein